MKTAGLLVAATALFAAAIGDDAQSPPATAQYDFMLGEWDLDVATMQPDQTMLPGTGVMNVHTIHDGQTLQADMYVSFENDTGFIGSTMRTYDVASENWAVSWVPAGAQAGAGAAGEWQDGQMVETWPSAEDQMGSHHDTLRLFDITADSFAVSMDRHYVNGPTIEGIWQYAATRRAENHADN